MGFTVSGAASPYDHAFLDLDVGGTRFELTLTLDIEEVGGEAALAHLRSGEDPLASVVLVATGDGTSVCLRPFSYPLLPADDLFPDVERYPSGDLVVPEGFPETPVSGEGTFDTEVMTLFGGGEVRLTFSVRGSGSYDAEVELYCEERLEGGLSRTKNAYIGPVNWHDRPFDSLLVGAAFARDGSFEVRFSDLELHSEVESLSGWYLIRDAHGVRVSEVDEGKKWIGALDPDDEDTHTEPTDVRALTRSDYARPVEELEGESPLAVFFLID